ncbi:MAG: hypothetical protein ACRC6T_01585 [Sarcina sp.]
MQEIISLPLPAKGIRTKSFSLLLVKIILSQSFSAFTVGKFLVSDKGNLSLND